MNPIDHKKIMDGAKKALIAKYEKIMNDAMRKEFPDLPNAKATYLLDKDDFVFTGLTHEQEAHIRKLPK